MCEKVWRKAQEYALKKGLVTDKLPKLAHVWSMQGSWKITPAVALQDKTSSLAKPLAHDLNSQLIPIASSSRQTILFVTKLTLRIPYIPYYKYPYTHDMWRASREKL